ncbi:MAG: hypothetical protein R3E66_22335 [bacterium]
MSLDVGNEDEVTATFLVSGQNAAQVIDSAGDLAAALASPAHAALAHDGLTQLDASETQVKLTAIEVKHQIGAEVGLGSVTVNPTAELSTSTGLAVQQKFELSLNPAP